MKTALQFILNDGCEKTCSRLPRHDLFFGTPVNSPSAGLPIGDGDVGSLIWLEKDGLHVHVNKCDLWKDAPAGATADDEIFCSDREEALTSLLHGGEITLKFDFPLFDYMYQEDFSARLSLTDASARVHAKTPFGELNALAFADAVSHVSVLRCAFSAEEAAAPDLRVFRFGSRNMWRWYSQQKFAPSVGLSGTKAAVNGDCLLITQEPVPVGFCLGVLIDGGPAAECSVRNGHVCTARFEPKNNISLTLYYTIATGDTAEEARDECVRRLRAAKEQGSDALFAGHKRAWEHFWNCSYVAYTDDYVENIYYLYLYYMNSQSRGAYPPHFTRGLWGVYHDYIPWNYYFHYNMQHMYMPLDAAGHGELADNYFAMRRRALDTARLFAQREKKLPGAFYHDVTDRYGRAAAYDAGNCTPGAQIAMQMYRHWRFTGDKTFLKETVLPVMESVCEFYLGLLQKGKNGLYHIRNTTAYEGNRPTDDTLTDLVMVRALFSVCVPLCGEALRERLTAVLSALPAPIRVPLAQEDLENGAFARGIGKGKTPRGDGSVFAMGLRDGKPARNMQKEPEYGFPDIELCPLYPAGIFGLKDKNGPLFPTMMNQILLGGRVDMEWSMYPVYLARMGMAKPLLSMQREMLDRFQRFPNGFNAETGMPPAFDTPAWDNVKNTDTGTVTKVDPLPFTHFDFETAPIIAQSVHEALLQSHEGVIRLFPAVDNGECAAFSLFAEGGIRVRAERSEDGFAASFDDLRGEGFYVALPECIDTSALYLYRFSGGEWKADAPCFADTGYETVLDFSTCAKGERVLLASVSLEEISYAPEAPATPNARMKECLRAYLGSPGLPK